MSEQNGFHFSLTRVSEAERDLDLQISAIEAHIDKCIKAAEIKGHPAISYALQLSHDPDDLLRMSEGLKLVAQHIKNLDRLKARKSVFEAATNEPMWFEWAFSDMTAPDQLDAVTVESFNKQ